MATYRLLLNYEGSPQEVCLNFPDLYYHYVIQINGDIISTGNGESTIFFCIEEGCYQLEVTTESEHGFYSGMYYPPLITLVEDGLTIQNIHTVAGTILWVLPFFLACYTFMIWRRESDELLKNFAMFCLGLSGYVFYYLARLFDMPFMEYYYIIQCISLTVLCYYAFLLSYNSAQKWTKHMVQMMSGVIVILTLLVEVDASIIPLHAMAMKLYFILLFLITIISFITKKDMVLWEDKIASIGSIIFGNCFRRNDDSA